MESLGVSSFWKEKRVLVTGHTGFKGGWLCLWLEALGARVSGLALEPDTNPNMFDQLGLATMIDHAIIDIRDQELVSQRIEQVQPEVVFHLAAQPLVLRSYEEPVETWQTNVTGTLHVLDALRRSGRPATLVISTTDKVYENQEQIEAYRETDRLGGHDPYSASKAATELLAASWRDSFAGDGLLRIATARAGNVIGGGDFAENRIVPDIVRALSAGRAIEVRNPKAVRPWQHVLEPLSGYLKLAQQLHEDPAYARAYNFGPAAGDFRSVSDLVDAALRVWPGRWEDMSNPHAHHEAGLLAVASDIAHSHLGWAPCWAFEAAVEQTLEWYRAVAGGEDPRAVTLAQIQSFQSQ